MLDLIKHYSYMHGHTVQVPGIAKDYRGLLFIEHFFDY